MLQLRPNRSTRQGPATQRNRRPHLEFRVRICTDCWSTVLFNVCPDLWRWFYANAPSARPLSTAWCVRDKTPGLHIVRSPLNRTCLGTAGVYVRTRDSRRSSDSDPATRAGHHPPSDVLWRGSMRLRCRFPGFARQLVHQLRSVAVGIVEVNQLWVTPRSTRR